MRPQTGYMTPPFSCRTDSPSRLQLSVSPDSRACGDIYGLGAAGLWSLWREVSALTRRRIDEGLVGTRPDWPSPIDRLRVCRGLRSSRRPCHQERRLVRRLVQVARAPFLWLSRVPAPFGSCNADCRARNLRLPKGATGSACTSSRSRHFQR